MGSKANLQPQLNYTFCAIELAAIAFHSV